MDAGAGDAVARGSATGRIGGASGATVGVASRVGAASWLGAAVSTSAGAAMASLKSSSSGAAAAAIMPGTLSTWHKTQRSQTSASLSPSARQSN